MVGPLEAMCASCGTTRWVPGPPPLAPIPNNLLNIAQAFANVNLVNIVQAGGVAVAVVIPGNQAAGLGNVGPGHGPGMGAHMGAGPGNAVGMGNMGVNNVGANVAVSAANGGAVNGAGVGAPGNAINGNLGVNAGVGNPGQGANNNEIEEVN